MFWEGNYLAHYGIKGQRWGIRRFQNEDGTLTAEGKKRYSKNDVVFVSGSSKTQDEASEYYRKELPKEIRNELDEAIKSGSKFVVGDAPGIDRQVQDYLNSKKYENVEIYGPGEKVRYSANKDWKTNPINDTEHEPGSKEWLAKKDIAMTNASTIGLAVVLDEGAKATRANVQRLKDQNKDVKVFSLNKDMPDEWIENGNTINSDKNKKVKKLLIATGAVLLTAAIGYSVYKSRHKELIEDADNYASNIFEHAASFSKDPQLLNRLKNDFNTNIKSTLSEKEKSAILGYSKDDFLVINHLLEQDENGRSRYRPLEASRIVKERLEKYENRDKYLDEIKTLTDVLDRSRSPEDMVVNRKCDFMFVRGMFGNNFTAKDLEKVINNPSSALGLDLAIKGFCSTSIDPKANGTFGTCNLHIFVPKGSKGMFIAPIANAEKETEFLLQKGSKFILKDIKNFSKGDNLYASSVELFLELIP